MRQKLPALMMSVCVVLSTAFAFGETVNLGAFIRSCGLNVGSYVSGRTGVDDGLLVKPYDGEIDYTDYTVRWHGNFTDGDIFADPLTTCYSAIKAPGAFKPTSYRVYGPMPKANSNDDRRPLRWKLYGVTTGNATNLIDETQEDVVWAAAWPSGQSQEYKERTIAANLQSVYREFIWVPTKNNGGISGAANQAIIVELEIYGEPYTPVNCAPMDSRYGDEVAIQPFAVSMDDYFPVGTQLTLTPDLNTEKGNQFLRWEVSPADLVADDRKTNSTLTFTLGVAPCSVTLWTQQPWVYDPSEGIITNDVWKLYVTDLGDNRLDIGRDRFGYSTYLHSAYYITATNGNTVTIQGDGLLDLSAPVKCGDQEYTITKMRASCLASGGSYFSNGSLRGPQVISTLIMPRTVTELGEDFCAFMGADIHQATLKKLVFDIPQFSGTLPKGSFLGQTNLATVVIKAPQMVGIHSDAFGSKYGNVEYGFAPFSSTDLSDWELDSLESLPAELFYVKNEENFHQVRPVTGKIRLPHITRIGHSCFRMGNLTGIELGSAFTEKDKKTLTLDYSVFNGAGRLSEITFGPYHSMTNISTYASDPEHAITAFKDCHSLTNIVFWGRPPARPFIDNLLQAQSSITANAKTVVIRGSRALGWGALEGLSEATSEEMAKAPAGLRARERILGVYTTSDGGDANGDNTRKAWVIHSPSPHDPKGSLIIFR